MTILLTWAASATIIAIEDMVLAQSNSSGNGTSPAE